MNALSEQPIGMNVRLGKVGCMGLALLGMSCDSEDGTHTGETSTDDRTTADASVSSDSDTSETAASDDGGASSAIATETGGTLGSSAVASDKDASVGDPGFSDTSGSDASADHTSAASTNTNDQTNGEQTSGSSTLPGVSSGNDGSSVVDEFFQVNVHLASEEQAIAPTTVGIVTWSTTAGTPTDAKIEFGLTTDYGMVAPVDLSEEDFRTLLLGMKSEHMYHFRIVAMIGSNEVTSADYTLTTGKAPNPYAFKIDDFQVLSPEKREPGFILTSHWGRGLQDGNVMILDADGDIVWWRNLPSADFEEGIAKVAMSDDGRSLWMVHVAIVGGATLERVGMDGLQSQVYPGTQASHDIQPIGGSSMAYLHYGGDNAVMEIDQSGETRTVFDSVNFPVAEDAPPHHLNAVWYDKATATYAVSSLREDVYLFPQSGSTLENTALLTSLVGTNTSWGGAQHGVQLLPDNHLLMFANKEGGSQGPSTVLEFDLDTGAEVWRYEADLYTGNFGDVQRLPGGNTLVTYSNAGVMHEVTPDKELVLQLTGSDSFGYATWRPHLYAVED